MSIQQEKTRRKRVVLTVVGSPGDLYPYIAIAVGLRARGHNALVATSACHRQKVEALGVGFCAIQPDSAFVTDPVIMRRMMDSRWGTVRVGREIIMPAMRKTYDDISVASAGADLLVSHPLTACATRLVSEVTGVPWISTMITPLGFMSAYDFPIISAAPMASKALRLMGPTLSSPLIRLAKRATRFLAGSWYRLRKELGLPPDNDANALLDSHSRGRVLALFSPLLAAPKPDWPAGTITTGFPVLNCEETEGMGSALTEFLDAGPPPIVFTLGYSAAMVGEGFFETSVAIARRLGHRAVLIVGGDARDFSKSLSDDVAVHEYAPFSQLFPRAAAVVHAGGIGTTGLAMRSGRPCLVVPFAHDQLDNASRMVRLGVARMVARHRYTAAHVAAVLKQLIDDPRYRRRAAEVGEQVRQEDGVRSACDALEGVHNTFRRVRLTMIVRADRGD